MSRRIELPNNLRADLGRIASTTTALTTRGVGHVAHAIDVITLREYRARMDEAMSAVVEVLESHSGRIEELELDGGTERAQDGAA